MCAAKERPLKITILGAAAGWLAIDKPAGVSVHNEPGRDAQSLVASYLEAHRDLAQKTGWNGTYRPQPVHRLDRETSGVLVFATDPKSASRLQQEMQATLESRTTRKLYRAVVRGHLASDTGTWDHPLTDRAEGRRAIAGLAGDRKPCLTRFRVLRANQHVTEIAVELLSGRQHQIRRHAALAGHWILGDRRYGDPKHAARIEEIYGISRLFLHAEELTIRGSHAIDVRAPIPLEFLKLFGEGQAP